ncbi:hypothetical protein TeGR_g2886 [Tetraparma gracilis]|uniref:Saccharopine dehydrogenase NADP binding domain-containing protein n=1 Tax=Tetraparma gracilis TaxID=2962635 RepID=A0ABQ6M9T6_9STRA|nr:hypothetical protein TeGR_g2886 [Tetraparma gracilis]
MGFDLVLYGATGFTGTLAAKYVNSEYGSSLKWAIAGRTQSKLEKMKADLNLDCDILVADSGDKRSLLKMVKQTKVIATTAGPFARCGTLLVEACVESGVDYCDITGETNWVREMIAKYDDKARETGSRVVCHCGHDSVPWDLSAYMLAKKLKEENGEQVAKFDFYDDIKSAPSGGTLETALGIMFGSESKQKFPASKALGYDALLKTSSGKKSESALKAKNIGYTVALGSRGMPHRSFFFMAGVNANACKRSNAINNYGPNVKYVEGTSFTSIFAAILYVLGYIFYGIGIYTPPLRAIMRAFFLPKPGEGPSEEYMDSGYLHLTGVAKGSEGTVVKSTMSFNVDPGYKDTARMVVESALALALEGKKVTSGGGVFTPGACQKEVLLERLLRTGTTYKFH